MAEAATASLPDRPTERWTPASTRALLVIAVFCVVEWAVLRQPNIVGDWVGWRESDTQAIARNLAEPGSSVFYPRIDWGGDGPGYVETEFMLYPALIAPFLRIFGDVVWPGQLISLLSLAGAGWVLFGALRRSHGERPALAGLVAFLAAPVLSYIGTSIQPESLCLFGFVVAWSFFLRYEAEGNAKLLVPYALVGALAMLVKPTAAQIGVASFLLLVLGSREKLRTPYPWIAWAFMVSALGLFLWHASTLFRDYGNTFGVLSGGDSKVPKLRHLLMPGNHLRAASTIVLSGFGLFGAAAFVAALVTRRVTAPMWGLVAANALWAFVSMRYISNPSWGGIHYTIVSAVLAAHSAAAAYPLATDPEKRRRLVLAAGAAAALAGVAITFVKRRAAREPNEEALQVIAVGERLSQLAKPRELVVIRSSRFQYDQFWATPNNYEDPRVLYVSKTRGWVLGRDQTDPLELAKLQKKGARFYVEPGAGYVDEPVDPWLAANAKLVATTPLGGRIFCLNGCS